MKKLLTIKLTATDERYIAPINGVDVPTRIWIGITPGGIPIEAYILSIVPQNEMDGEAMMKEVSPFLNRSRDTFTVDVDRADKVARNAIRERE